jgi:hypothetical protein
MSSPGRKPRRSLSSEILPFSLRATATMATAGKQHQIFHTLRQLGIIAAKTTDLGDRFKNLPLVKLETVKQLIQLKAYRSGAGSLRFILDHKRPLIAGGRKLDRF